jgi:hypothetical protein
MATRKRVKALRKDVTGDDGEIVATNAPARPKALVFVSHDSRDGDWPRLSPTYFRM